MKPLSRRLYAIAALVLAAILFVAINIAADAWITTAQLDLTETGQFTLADGTRNIIAKIPEPITLQILLLQESRRRLRADRRLCQARARSARRVRRAQPRQDHPSGHRSRAVHGRRRRSDVERPDRRADGFRRHGLFRSCRHQPHRRQGSHPLLHAGARALSRIRPVVADLSPVDAAEAGARHHL